MIIPHTQLIIDDNLRIPPSDVYDVTLTTSIWSLTPTLSFKLKDQTGARFAKLHILIGSVIRIAIVDADMSAHNEVVPLENSPNNGLSDNDRENIEKLYWVKPNEDTDFIPTTFVVKEFFNAFEYSAPNAGFIQVNCVQSWNFYLEKKNSGYRGKISEIIKEVLKNSNSHNGIKKDSLDDSELFSSSSDDGEVIRHSAGICDKEFIEKNLVPYLNVNGEPGYFFIDAFGNARCTNLSKLENANVKALGFIRAGLKDKDNEQLADMLNSSGADFKFPIDSIKCALGQTDNISGLINSSSFIRVGTTLNTMGGTLQEDYITSDRTFNSGKGKFVVPISRRNFFACHASEYNFNPYWCCDTDKNLLRINAAKGTEKRVLAEIETGYISNTLKVGDVIQLYGAYAGDEYYWIRGKWTIGRIEYHIEKDMRGADIRDSMKITIFRRGIPADEKSSIQLVGYLT